MGRILSEYETAIREVLELAPLEQRYVGARRVVECTFMPSFDPECSITVVENARTEITVRALRRSVWAYLSAKRGIVGRDVVTEWVEPAHAIETHAIELPSTWTALVRATEPAPPPATGVGLDGMTVKAVIRDANATRSFDVWFGSRDDDARMRLVASVLELGLSAARFELSKSVLTTVSEYMR